MRQFPAAKVLLSLLLLLGTLMGCQKDEPTPQLPPAPADAYNFPVRPGTPAWAAFTTGQQMVDACQVPATTLSRMSTAGLVYTCLDYPLLGNTLAFNSIQRGTRAVMDNFNGFAELARRPDGAALLLARYQQMQAAQLPAPSQRGEYSFAFSYLEMVLAQPEFLGQLSAAQHKQLAREGLLKYADKQRYQDEVYGVFGLKTTAFLLARTMQTASYGPFLTSLNASSDMQYFLKEGEIGGKPQLLDSVVGHARQFN